LGKKLIGKSLGAEFVILGLKEREVSVHRLILAVPLLQDPNFGVVSAKARSGVLMLFCERIPDFLGRSLAVKVLELVWGNKGADKTDSTVVTAECLVVLPHIVLVFTHGEAPYSGQVISSKDRRSWLRKEDLLTSTKSPEAMAHELRLDLWFPVRPEASGEQRYDACAAIRGGVGHIGSKRGDERTKGAGCGAEDRLSGVSVSR
jgi:hypothetical protein